MSETVTLYFPDKRALWTPARGTQDQTDVEESGGREQRRARLPLGGRRLMTGDLEFLDLAARAVVRDFVKSLRGRYLPFYIFAWDPQLFTSFTVTLTYGTPAPPYVLPFTALTPGLLHGTVSGGSHILTGVTYDTNGPGGEARLVDPGLFAGSPPDAGTPLYLDVTSARERIPVRMQSDKQAETFVKSALNLAVRHIDVIEVL